MPELVEIVDGKLRLNLHPGQTQAWESRKRFVFIIAGTQSGKTSFGPHLFYRWIQEAGPGDYLAVTATYDLFKLKMLPEMKRVFCDWLRWGTYQASDRVIVSHDGASRIILRSANSPGGLESATVKAAWLDECGQDEFTLEAWEAVQRRLSLTQGRVLATTTPYNLGWLKTHVFDRWQAGDPDYDVIRFRSIDNPAFPVAEYERARQMLPAWKHAMFYDGEFARPAGLIYEDFDPAVHLVPPFAIPPLWPVVVGIDFGALHLAQVWLAEHPVTHVWYAFRESLTGGHATPEQASLASQLAANHRYVRFFGGAPGEHQARLDWSAAGIGVRRPPVADVEAQIERVITLLRQRRLLIFNNLSGLYHELSTYSRELDANGQPTPRIAHKTTYHRLDALRYAVAGLTAGYARARVREY
ncbi:MAG: terminase family protein [Caldilineales bacterium]|nr:terminase family protein [Caldilineales bacterium]